MDVLNKETTKDIIKNIERSLFVVAMAGHKNLFTNRLIAPSNQKKGTSSIINLSVVLPKLAISHCRLFLKSLFRIYDKFQAEECMLEFLKSYFQTETSILEYFRSEHALAIIPLLDYKPQKFFEENKNKSPFLERGFKRLEVFYGENFINDLHKEFKADILKMIKEGNEDLALALVSYDRLWVTEDVIKEVFIKHAACKALPKKNSKYVKIKESFLRFSEHQFDLYKKAGLATTKQDAIKIIQKSLPGLTDSKAKEIFYRNDDGHRYHTGLDVENTDHSKIIAASDNIEKSLFYRAIGMREWTYWELFNNLPFNPDELPKIKDQPQ